MILAVMNGSDKSEAGRSTFPIEWMIARNIVHKRSGRGDMLSSVDGEDEHEGFHRLGSLEVVSFQPIFDSQTPIFQSDEILGLSSTI